MPDLILSGDGTDHGGTVLEGFAQTRFHGRPIAGVGHKVSCPRCKGVFPIVEGSSHYRMGGMPVALQGMRTACGARLIAGGPRGRVFG